MRRNIYFIVLLSATIISSCKKETKTTPEPTQPTKTGSALDLMRDSVYLYAKEAYYWNDAIPDYATFKPRSYSGANDLAALQKEVDAISQFKINPITNQPYEYYEFDPGTAKYSFIDEGGVSEELGGTKGDFGFAPFYNTSSDLRVKYVYPGSPADLAGIKRGYKVTRVNNHSGSQLNSDNAANVDYVVDAYYNSNNISLTLMKPDGSPMEATLAAGSYTVNPVLATKVIDAGGGKKIGYVVFNSFTSDANARPKLDAAFGTFATEGVTDLVVDLRYNGGGYVSTAEYLTDLIAPASADGKQMFAYYFNSTLASGKATILKNQVRKDETTGEIYNYGDFSYTVANNSVKFSKNGLPVNNFKRVFFIVTGATASASELTINNLLPVMDVKFIGTTSYGKPVGFFNININKYEMYIPEFETKNSQGKGGYYAGMTPGSPEYPGIEIRDDVTKEFGDPEEGLLARAISYVKTGNFSVSGPRIQSVGSQDLSIAESNRIGLTLEGKKFRGTVFNTPMKLKKK